MVAPVEYSFTIEAYTPNTMPLARLARYLGHLAIILGEPKSIHLIRIDGGSTKPVLRVDWEDVPKVQKRVQDVRNNEGPKDALKAKADIEADLAEDNAKGGELTDQYGGKLLQFRRKAPPAQDFGPFNQVGSLDGIVTRIGAETASVDPVPVLLQGRESLLVCRAQQDVARKLLPYWLGDPVRVLGVGRWIRHGDGTWEMKHFIIGDFSPLKKDALSAVVNRLRKIPAAWKAAADPIGEMMRLRNDPADAES